MKLTCIVVEDEPLARERLTEYIGKTTSLRLLGEFEDAAQALAFLKEEHADLVFLDINLGRVSGIELLETSRLSSQVVITTAYHEFAIKGFELNVTDYLLKPFTFERFSQAVAKAVRLDAKPATPPPATDFVFIKTENRLEKIKVDDVLFIEGMRDYRKIHTTAKKIMTLQNFSDLEREFPRHLVCRVHKSYMVAISKIDSIEKDEIKIGGYFLPISETYRKSFFALLGK